MGCSGRGWFVEASRVTVNFFFEKFWLFMWKMVIRRARRRGVASDGVPTARLSGRGRTAVGQSLTELGEFPLAREEAEVGGLNGARSRLAPRPMTSRHWLSRARHTTWPVQAAQLSLAHAASSFFLSFLVRCPRGSFCPVNEGRFRSRPRFSVAIKRSYSLAI